MEDLGRHCLDGWGGWLEGTELGWRTFAGRWSVGWVGRSMDGRTLMVRKAAQRSAAQQRRTKPELTLASID